ncbi:hypothetical protein QQF64_018412 [Cirrhinus molitorella]|uniref:Uncharacterized protein n=1 Tax=Cirrhinus molitorella TaxID=172907 RepID=A0ABR3LF41_9TELE
MHSARVTDIPLVDLNQLCTHLDIRCMTEREYQLLKEILKGSETRPVGHWIYFKVKMNCYYGTLQPTLEILMAKILALKEGLSNLMADLPDLIVQVCTQSTI